MRNFTRIDKEHIQINALFIQPTTFCSLDCRGCYVKGWAKNADIERMSEHLSGWFWKHFMNHMIGLGPKGTDYHTNQMTFALDVPPPGNVRRTYLAKLFEVFLDTASLTKETEFHITTNSLSNLNDYEAWNSLRNIDVLSISNLRPQDLENLELLKLEYPDLTINWNHQPSSQPPSKEAYLAEIVNIAKHLDNIYLILHKPDLGKHIDSSLAKSFLPMYKEIQKALFKAGLDSSMLNIDGCVSDAKQYSEFKTEGCSSNISRFQIWPDGSISGCPYSQSRITDGVEAVNQNLEQALEYVFNNIIEAKKIYQFNSCKIPEDLYPESDRNFRKKHRGLVIFED